MSVSVSFTEAGVSPQLSLKPGESATYSVTGTFTGFVDLERSSSPLTSFQKEVIGVEDEGFSGTFKNESKGTIWLRFRAIDTDGETPITGTAVCELTDVDDVIERHNDVVETTQGGQTITGNHTVSGNQSIGGTQTLGGHQLTSVGVGAKNGATVSAVERGNGAVHQTVLTLASTPVPIVSVADGAGVGGVKLYEFPEGRILVLGCMADLTLAVDAAEQDNFTDATPAGDAGIGSVIIANDDALGTDATDDDMATGDDFTMADFEGAVKSPSEASKQFDGTETPLEANLNVLVDAGDIDDDAETEVLASGTVVLTWINLGDL